MPFPNLNIDFNIPEAQDNAGNAGSGWCKSKWEAKANKLANKILWKWGFATTAPDGNKPSYRYDCGLFGAEGFFYGKGIPISAQKARQTYNCEQIESLQFLIEPEYQRAVKRVNNAGLFGGASAKNAKIDKLKWTIVKDFSLRATGYQDGTINTCIEEANEAAYNAILDQGQEYLSSRPEGISNGVLAALIGGGAMLSILIVNKFVK